MRSISRAWRVPLLQTYFQPGLLSRTSALDASFLGPRYLRHVSGQAGAPSTRKRRPFWTKEEVKRLEELRQQGTSHPAIASKLGKSLSSVENKLRSLDDPFHVSGRRTRSRWSREEVDRLEELQRQGWGLPAVATELGRTQRPVSDRWYGVTKGLATEPDRPWSAAETTLLFCLNRIGISNSKIATLLGRTRGSVYVKLLDNGRVHIRRAWTWNEVNEALALHEKGMTKPDIARKLQRSVGSVNRALYHKERESTAEKYWTAEEDDLLLELKLKYGNRKLIWEEFSRQFPARSRSAIRRRWSDVLSVKDKHPVRYTKVAVPWSHAETDLLRRLKDERQLSWADMLAHFPGRSISALKGQYHVVIKGMPHTKSPYTVEEDSCMSELSAANQDVPTIARKIPGRTRIAISRRLAHLHYRQHVKELDSKGDTSSTADNSTSSVEANPDTSDES